MEKSIYVYGLNRIESTCYFEILDANNNKFVGAGERSGNPLTVARELKAQESRRGDTVKVYISKFGFDFADL
jgi:hypothetical protein